MTDRIPNDLSKDTASSAPTVGPRGLARRQALLDAARRLFIEKGFEKTTLSDIIALAGGSRATLYEHFGDKAGLFRAMMEESSANILKVLCAAHADESVSPEAGLTCFAMSLVRELLSERAAAVLRVLIAEGGRIPDVADSFFRIGPDTSTIRLAEYLKHLSDAGVLRIDNPRDAAQAFLGMVTGSLLIRVLILPESTPPMEELERYVRQSVALFLHGTRPGP